MLRSLTIVLALSLPFACLADSASQRLIRIVVPYGPGGTPDQLARMLAEKLSADLGQSVVVENKPGAGGAIAAQSILNAPADGQTLWVADSGQLAITPALQKNLNYEPLKDFTPVGQIGSQPFFIWTRADSGIPDLRTLVELARAQPGKLNYGTVGNGSPHHLCMAMLANIAGVELTHIPYKSAAQMVTALVTGDVSAICTSPVSAGQLFSSGKAKPIAVASRHRYQGIPDTPTVEETLHEPLEVVPTIGVLVRSGTPQAAIGRLSTSIQAALKMPDVQDRLGRLYMEPSDGLPSTYLARMKRERTYYARMVRVSGASID
ncbi:Bug family tripartite tricarboxylate transporter substrate binding protein [Pigmentiphaga kullae]|uniref:Tripartite-type tricarboxylate transporter receptor subunit TctC n=1 Tax=Pigmentiphaga kullae TaxID=151784 RepID=A0A4V2F3M8_9BURK|nr:tripartite tricarboxylate transporter substrate binding protein [Pigmentiphaga kullae]RZS84657.1 tripartite-type tricarboxylate transporter receptor subunit TctC [Pigmentiphaga kullae]